MRATTVDFVKGHMGGNEIILLNGDQIPTHREIEVSLLALRPPNIRGHEAGLFYKSRTNDKIKVKIVSVSGGHFIGSCGGLTQVFGRAVIETDFMQLPGLEDGDQPAIASLETDTGIVSLCIYHHKHSCDKVVTNMTPFLAECYTLGINQIRLRNVSAMKIGAFLVVNGNDLLKQYPNINLDKMDTLTLDVLDKIEKDFSVNGYPVGKTGGFAVYDLNPRGNASGRVIFPHDISAGHIEPTCGTGTVAVGIAMVASGEIGVDNSQVELSFESGGSSSSIGGPDITELQLKVEGGKAVEAYFSHSLVEILATGELWI